MAVQNREGTGVGHGSADTGKGFFKTYPTGGISLVRADNLLSSALEYIFFRFAGCLGKGPLGGEEAGGVILAEPSDP